LLIDQQNIYQSIYLPIVVVALCHQPAAATAPLHRILLTGLFLHQTSMFNDAGFFKFQCTPLLEFDQLCDLMQKSE
jgi:hypothetical protein